MPATAPKFHIFKEKTFQGLVYCDYCGKLLWGLARQGVHCTECGYNCHSTCSDMVIQCRPQRRWSPDSLSVTDSDAESVSKYSLHSYTHRTSTDRDDNNSTSSRINRTNEPIHRPTKSEDSLKSPTTELIQNHQRTKASLNKSYRSSLKQQLQKQNMKNSGSSSEFELLSPHATAKAFTRLVARSKAFFYVGASIYDIYSWKNKFNSTLACILWISLCINLKTALIIPPLLVWLLYNEAGIQVLKASQVLFPRYDDNTPEYYINLETMQHAFIFFIRLYDNLAYHLQHVQLNGLTYSILLIMSLIISLSFAWMGRWLVMVIGLMLLLNKTWIGTTIEAILMFFVEVLQTTIDLIQKIKTKEIKPIKKKPMNISIYENQRWWTGSGYTSQLLRSERANWSNITGTEPLPSKEEMPPPVNYIWDDEWHLDTTGPWTDDALEIGILYTLIECDEMGWVYSDHKWNNPRSKPEVNKETRALTRRRRWYRKAIPVDQKLK